MRDKRQKMNLGGKTEIVTGDGRDAGRACVMHMAEVAAYVAINYHSISEGADSAVRNMLAAMAQSGSWSEYLRSAVAGMNHKLAPTMKQ